MCSFSHHLAKASLMNISSLIVILALAWSPKDYTDNQLPSIEMRTLTGETVDIKDYTNKGKVLVINYWATWCSPCKRELDAIADLYPEWKDAYNMELIAVSIDDARALAKVRPLVESKGWEYEILSDSKQASQQALNFQTIPQTFVVDASGNIVHMHNGYKPGDEYELEDILKELSSK